MIRVDILSPVGGKVGGIENVLSYGQRICRSQIMS